MTDHTPPADHWSRTYQNQEPVPGVRILAALHGHAPQIKVCGELQLDASAAGITASMDIDLTPNEMRSVAATLLAQADYLDHMIGEAARLNGAPDLLQQLQTSTQ